MAERVLTFMFSIALYVAGFSVLRALSNALWNGAASAWGLLWIFPLFFLALLCYAGGKRLGKWVLRRMKESK